MPPFYMSYNRQKQLSSEPSLPMKRIFSVMMLLSCFLTMRAQIGDVVLYQGFYAAWLDEGWGVSDEDWVAWFLSNTQNAGGKPREIQMNLNYNFEGTTRIYTPKLNLSKYDILQVHFSQCIETTRGNEQGCIGIAVSDDGESWESVWEDTIRIASFQREMLVNIDMDEWSSRNKHFSLYYSGSGEFLNNWYIDNIIVYASKKEELKKQQKQAKRKKLFGRKNKSSEFSDLDKMKRSRSRYARIVGGGKRRW